MIDLQKLQAAVEGGWVSISERGDLQLYNYTRECQYESHWTPETLQARGLIMKGEKIVALPFEKFFNWGQEGRTSTGHIVEVTEKQDGSLGILYREDGVARIATRGSFESEQALWATDWLPFWWQSYLMDQYRDLTLLFEIVYPDNRIVVDYQGWEGLILIGARSLTDGSYLPYYPDLYEISQVLACEITPTVNFNSVVDLLVATGRIGPNKEGWVVTFSDGKRFKFKGDEYVELHRILSRFTEKKIYEKWLAGEREWGQKLPDEFHQSWEKALVALDTHLTYLEEESARYYRASYHEDRKTFALNVNRSVPQHLRKVMFMLYDQKDPRLTLMKLVGDRVDHLILI